MPTPLSPPSFSPPPTLWPNYQGWTSSQILAEFARYEFRDTEGHPLTHCEAFLSLVDRASAPRPLPPVNTKPKRGFVVTALAWTGAAVMALAILGVLEVGHFRLYYGSAPSVCVVTP